MASEARELKLGVYQHYKGQYYLVLGLAHHSETMEKLVVYVPLYMREGPRMCVRPLDMFLEDICIVCATNQRKDVICPHTRYNRAPRFEYIDQEGFEINAAS